MAHAFPHALDDCRKEEEKLGRLVADDTLKSTHIDESLCRHRDICSDVLLSDFSLATSPAFRAEDRLWDNHQKVNSKFRAELAKLRKSSEPKSVELRKLSHDYLKFIKSSQSFYRSLIKKLDQTYGGIPSLHRVAKKLRSELPSATDTQPLQQPSAAQLEQYCHRVLIHLGDLSRYRETELSGSEKHWGPALGYYDLALSVCPNSGIPFNQRAVIALSDKALFRALYYVYRSISAQEPHPQGEQNLRRALQKVQQAWASKELTSDPSATAGASLPEGLVAWYLRLLEIFFHGKTSPEKEELENEVMTQLKFDLQKNPSTESPRKLILTAIAAQHTAQERFEQNQSNTNQTSYLLFLELNVKLFSSLLFVYAKEGETLLAQDTSETGEVTHGAETSPVLRRLLPGLRLYSLWLEKTNAIIESPVSGISSSIKSELWASYAKALSLIISKLHPDSTATLTYMLEEDEDTIGFKPLLSPNNRRVWYQDEKLKPRWHELPSGSIKDTEQETVFRMQEIALQGLDLALAKKIPITYDQENRIFQFNADRGFHISKPKTKDDSDAPHSAVTPVNGNANTAVDRTAFRKGGAEAAQDQEAERMVDNIVGGTNALDMTNTNEVVSQGQLRQISSRRSSGVRRSFGAASPLPTGPHTVGDIMAATYNQPKSASPRIQNINMERSGSGSRPTSTMHSPSVGQQQVRYSSDISQTLTKQPIAAQFAYPEDPALPGLGIMKPTAATQSTPQQPSSPQNRTSPLPPPTGHSRTNSGDMGRNIWGGGIFDPSYHRGEANQAFGSTATTAPQSDPAAASRVPNTFPDHPNTSEMLQGVTDTWNHRLRRSQQEATVGPLMSSASYAHGRTDSGEAWNGHYGVPFTEWHQA